MASIAVRFAREEDREAVLAFCANTWEWGDYIERVWEQWLHDPEGRLFVAADQEQPVGIVHLQMLTHTDAWLEGMRIDPQYRRRGIARALDETAILEAMRLGATYIRLATETENHAAIQLSESLHMRRVGAFTQATAAPLTGVLSHDRQAERTRLATLDDLDEVIDYLNVSNIFPSVGGLYYVRFRAYAITAELLEGKIVAQQVFLLHRWGRLDGLAIAEARKDWTHSSLSLGYIDGTAIEAVSLIAHDLRRRVSETGLEKVVAYAPDLVLIRDAFTGIGYEWDDTTFYTYERGLT